MELDKFISDALSQIIKGVKDAQQYASDNDARINPHINTSSGKEKITGVFYGKEDGLRPLNNIEFDIAVTVSNQKESGLEGGIKVFSFNAGGKNMDTEITNSVSRIKFNINAVLPNVKP